MNDYRPLVRNASVCTRRVLSMLMLASAPFAMHSAGATTLPLDQTTIQVRYDDLDLSKKAGTTALERRIRQAADRVCGGLDQRVIRRAAEYQRCTREASARALAQVS